MNKEFIPPIIVWSVAVLGAAIAVLVLRQPAPEPTPMPTLTPAAAYQLGLMDGLQLGKDLCRDLLNTLSQPDSARPHPSGDV